VLGLTQKLAACFTDMRNPAFIEHEVETLVMQRVVGIALGYEDLNDHDELRHDPVLATLAGKLTARRRDCAPLAGKSTLNRLELSRAEPTRYARLAVDTAAIEKLLVDLFLDAHNSAPKQITLDLDATDDPLHGHQEGRFFHGYYDCYCYKQAAGRDREEQDAERIDKTPARNGKGAWKKTVLGHEMTHSRKIHEAGVGRKAEHGEQAADRDVVEPATPINRANKLREDALVPWVRLIHRHHPVDLGDMSDAQEEHPKDDDDREERAVGVPYPR
jgi:Transposase DDE domain group 1